MLWSTPTLGHAGYTAVRTQTRTQLRLQIVAAHRTSQNVSARQSRGLQAQFNRHSQIAKVSTTFAQFPSRMQFRITICRRKGQATPGSSAVAEGAREKHLPLRNNGVRISSSGANSTEKLAKAALASPRHLPASLSRLSG